MQVVRLVPCTRIGRLCSLVLLTCMHIHTSVRRSFMLIAVHHAAVNVRFFLTRWVRILYFRMPTIKKRKKEKKKRKREKHLYLRVAPVARTPTGAAGAREENGHFHCEKCGQCEKCGRCKVGKRALPLRAEQPLREVRPVQRGKLVCPAPFFSS